MGLHTYTMQNVAIKILDKDKIVDESDKIRVAREIQILRKIRHPNIVQLFEILSAVEYLHQNNIVHRDLKPENLLLDYNNSIKVVDFGLSNMYENGQTLKTACGSPCYAAPEMVSGKRYEGLKTDIWSCGIILYAMLCGYLPFEDQNTTDLYKKIINDTLKLPKFLTERSKSILNGILEKDPAKRFTIDQIRHHEFCILNSNQPILKGISFGREEILVDPLILQLIKDQYSIDADQARVMIQNNKHNQVTATYYLLLNSHIRNGGVSIADLSRPPTNKKASLAIQSHPQSAQKSSNIGGDSTTKNSETTNVGSSNHGSAAAVSMNQNNIGQSTNGRIISSSDTKTAQPSNEQQNAQPQNANYSERVNSQNREAPNKSSTPMKKISDYKAPTSTFEHYVSQQQKIRGYQKKEKSPQSNGQGKSSSYLTSPLSESPVQQEKEYQKHIRKSQQEDKSPIILLKSPVNPNDQQGEDLLKQSPYFTPMIIDGTDHINQSPNKNGSSSNMNNMNSSIKKQNQQEEINFIKNNLNESLVKKQNFFLEDDKSSPNQKGKQVDHNLTLNNKQIIPNSTFGGSFCQNLNGTQGNNNSKLHERLSQDGKPKGENGNNLEKQQTQDYQNEFIVDSNSNLEKSDDEQAAQTKSTVTGGSPQRQSVTQTRPINNPKNSRSTGLPSASPQQKTGLSEGQAYQHTNMPMIKGNNMLNIQSSKIQNREIVASQKSRNGNENAIDSSTQRVENSSLLQLQNHSGVYAAPLKQDAGNQNYSNIKISTGHRKVASKEDNVTSLQLQIIQQGGGDGISNQQVLSSNKNGSKIVVKIHHKAKSETGLSRRLMNVNGLNQKENMNTESDQLMQSPAFKQSLNQFSQSVSAANSQMKNTNEKISNLIRSANQKGGLNIIQKELSANSYKQHLPSFFNNQAYLSSNPQQSSNNAIKWSKFIFNEQYRNHFINSSHTNNNTATTTNNYLDSSNQQTNQSANNYYSKQFIKTHSTTEPNETSSVRQKLKQISSQRQSTIGNTNSTFKVRIRKSATPELNHLNNSNANNNASINNNYNNNNNHNSLFINGQQNVSSQQQQQSQQNRSNSNNSISNQNSVTSNAGQINQIISPEKRVKTKQNSRSSRRFVSAERENNQLIQQSLIDEPTKNKFFRQEKNSLAMNNGTLNNQNHNSINNNASNNNAHQANYNNKQSESSQNNIGDYSASEKKKQDSSTLKIPLINKDIKEPKIRVISESPMYKKDQQSNESKYYLGLKQQMISKEPLICNFSVNNDSNINHQLTNNDGINSTIDEISQPKSGQKLTSWPHSQNYYLNVPINSSNSNNKSYLNNISNTSRISAHLNDQILQNSQQQQPQMENSKSEHLRLKAVTNSLISNSYSLVNVQKYKVRKSKINSGLHNISNSIMSVNNVVNSLIKDK